MRAPADNVTPPLPASSGDLRQLLRTTLGGVLFPAVICAALWIAISYLTGASTLFSLGGGVLVGVVAFIIGYGVRSLIIGRRPVTPSR